MPLKYLLNGKKLWMDVSTVVFQTNNRFEEFVYFLLLKFIVRGLP